MLTTRAIRTSRQATYGLFSTCEFSLRRKIVREGRRNLFFVTSHKQRGRNEPLREYVQERLAGKVRRLDGTPVPGPGAAPWKGRNKPRRQDRRWANAWSPEQISHRLKVDFPDDESMRISHEAIYQALYVQSTGTSIFPGPFDLPRWSLTTCPTSKRPSAS